MSDRTYHPDEPHGQGHRAQLNWLRAGVLGANDGIVSIAALLLGGASIVFVKLLEQVVLGEIRRTCRL